MPEMLEDGDRAAGRPGGWPPAAPGLVAFRPLGSVREDPGEGVERAAIAGLRPGEVQEAAGERSLIGLAGLDGLALDRRSSRPHRPPGERRTGPPGIRVPGHDSARRPGTLSGIGSWAAQAWPGSPTTRTAKPEGTAASRSPLCEGAASGKDQGPGAGRFASLSILPSFMTKQHPLGGRDVGGRVAGHGDDVGELARLERPHLGGDAEQLGVERRWPT